MGEPNRRGPQVKEAIVTLCRIFKYSGVYESVVPDDIRLAKFDKPEAVSTLLKLLQNLLKLRDPLNGSELCSKMQSLRYPRSNHIVSSEGSFKSSRELLLAISWVLHVTKFIDRIHYRARQRLDVSKLWRRETKSENSSVEFTDNLSVTEKVSKLTWSVAQLSLWKKQFISTKVGTEVSKAKLSKDLISEFKDDPLLLLVLKNPSFCNEYEKALEKKIYLLHACIQWTSLQSTFWAWMDSVLANAPNTDSCPPMTSSKGCIVEDLTSELHKKINFLQQRIREQRLLYPKSTVDFSISSLSPEMKMALNKEMEELRTRVVDPCFCPGLRQAADAALGGDSSIHIDVEISRLAEQNEHHIQKIQEFRSKTRKKLESYSTNFPGMVLVPPSDIKRGRSVVS